MRYLSDMLGAMRDDRPPAAFAAIREAFGALATTVRETMDDLAAGRGMTGDSYERLNALLNFQHSLEAAADTLTGIAGERAAFGESEDGRRYFGAVVEGLDAVVLALCDVLDDHDGDDRAMLALMTDDQGNGMKGVRAAYLAEERAVDPDDRLRLLAVANHAERLIWLVGDMGRSEPAIAAG